MERRPTYVAYYFQTDQGRCPVAQFVDSMVCGAQGKFFAKRRLLEEFGPGLPQPHAKPLGRGIYELRFSGREADFRNALFLRWPSGDFYEWLQERNTESAPA